GGEWLEPGETYTTISPSSEEPLAQVGQATAEEVDAAGRAGREAFSSGWGGVLERVCGAAGLGAGEVPLPDRAHPPGALARVRGARIAERRQADQGVARGGPA